MIRHIRHYNCTAICSAVMSKRPSIGQTKVCLFWEAKSPREAPFDHSQNSLLQHHAIIRISKMSNDITTSRVQVSLNPSSKSDTGIRDSRSE